MSLRTNARGIAHMFLVLLLIVAILIAATFVYLKKMNNTPSGQNSATQKSSASLASRVKLDTLPKQIMAEITQAIAKKYDVVLVNIDATDYQEPTAKDDQVQVRYSAAGLSAYKTPGYDFYTYADDDFNISLWAPFQGKDGEYSENAKNQARDSIRKQIDPILTKYKLVQLGSNQDVSGTVATDTYKNSEIYCTVREDSLDGVVVDCGTFDGYASAAKRAQPLWGVIPSDQRGSGTYFNVGVVQASKTTGYKYVVGDIGGVDGGGSGILFYHHEGDGWHYVKNSQEGWFCEDFNTPTLRKAFNGFSCQTSPANPDKKSVVTPLATD